MHEYVTVKTKEGLDLVGILMQDGGEYVIIEHPLELKVDPHQGLFAKSFLLLSEQDSVLINKNDVFYVQVASDRAIEYYEEFRERLNNSSEYDSEEYTSDLEDVFNTMIEAKSSIKH